ncbi:TniQ family protein [Roseibium sp.]|uniref:TniQ family protein n=1 Tax=Roseibium sp. TaxID=1936156 RepID=UPI003BAA86BA
MTASTLPMAQESLDGYLRRLAESEFWADVSDFLKSHDLQYGRQLVENCDTAEQVLGLHAGTLASIAPALAPETPRLKWRFERHHSAPVCPACISEGRPHHQSWRHSFVTCCIEHKTRLVDTCPVCWEVFRPGRGGYQSCECGFQFDRLECVPATQEELSVAALIGEQKHPTRSLLPPKLKSETPPDIGDFLFFIASEHLDTKTGKHGKSGLPRTIKESRAFLESALAVLCDWPNAFRVEVARRLASDVNASSSAPARLGRWYQRLMEFNGDEYSDFRTELTHLVKNEFDGIYFGNIEASTQDRSWMSAAHAARDIGIRAERLVDAVSSGAVPGTQHHSGMGHRHTVIHESTLDEIKRNRQRFIDKKSLREDLGISRKQCEFLISSGFLKPYPSEELPPLVDGLFERGLAGDLVAKIAKAARAIDCQTIAFKDLNLRFTTDRSGLKNVFDEIASQRLRPKSGTTNGKLADFHFASAEVDAVLAEAKRGSGWTMQEVAQLTGWKGHCISEWCRQGLLKHEAFDHAGGVGRVIEPEALARFQMQYVPLSELAKQLGTSSRSLLKRFNDRGIQTVGSFQDGPAIRGHLVPIATVWAGTTP